MGALGAPCVTGVCFGAMGYMKVELMGIFGVNSTTLCFLHKASSTLLGFFYQGVHGSRNVV